MIGFLAWQALVRTRGQPSGRGFVSFMAAISWLGITLGVASLLLVLSVMNGFTRDVKATLACHHQHVTLTPRREVQSWSLAQQRQLQKRLQRTLSQLASLRRVTTFYTAPALLWHPQAYTPMLALFTEEGVQHVDASPKLATSQAPQTPLQLVLSPEVAHAWHLHTGSNVKVVLPRMRSSLVGHVPMQRDALVTRLGPIAGRDHVSNPLAVVVGVDHPTITWMRGVELPTGWWVQVRDPLQASQDAAFLAQALGPAIHVEDWSVPFRPYFRALALQKQVFGLMVGLIVLVAAFNLVSGLAVSVHQKRRDVAILRVLGYTKGQVLRWFLYQATLITGLAVLAGTCLGLWASQHITSWQKLLEAWLQHPLMDRSVFVLDYLPSHVLRSDVLWVISVTMLLGILAGVYPAWRAASIDPTMVLRGGDG